MIALAYMRVADALGDLVPCFVGDPPDNIPPPFCFVWGPLPVEEAHTVAGALEVVSLPFHVQVVAKQAPDVLLLAAQVKQRLRSADIQVEGWRVFPLKVTGSEPVQTDRAVANAATDTYPAWITLHAHLNATKEIDHGATG